jgi:hypothetical protein
MSGATVAPATVVAVLLADGWHQVVHGSFSVGALGFGAEADPDVPGFCFEEAGNGSLHRPAALADPLTSILAVRQAGAARRPGGTGRPAARH